MKTKREKVIERIEKARGKKDLGRYIIYGSAGVEEVRCKFCNTAIRHLAPDDRFQEVREIRGKKTIVERLMLVTLPAYVEVLIHFDDDSKHVTAMCEACSKTLTIKDLEWAYCADLNEWLLDGSNASEDYWAQQEKRKPKSFEAFAPGEIAS